jgi:hypothetical protein
MDCFVVQKDGHFEKVIFQYLFLFSGIVLYWIKQKKRENSFPIRANCNCKLSCSAKLKITEKAKDKIRKRFVHSTLYVGRSKIICRRDLMCSKRVICIQSPSGNRTVVGFRIRSYASTGHLKTGPFEIRTNVSRFQMVAKIGHFIKKKSPE